MHSKHPALSRRHFVQALGLAPLLGPAARAAAEVPPAPPLAVFGKVFQELKLDYDQSAELVAGAGLDGVDCAARPGGEVLPERAADDLPRYDEALRRRGQRLLLLTTGITGTDTPHAEPLLRAAHGLGVTFYRIGYWMQEPAAAPALRGDIRARLRDLAALNRQLGVCALFQNHSSRPGARKVAAGGDLGELYEIMQGLDPGQVAVAFDIGHALLTHGEGWASHFERLRPWIRVAYLKDARIGQGFVPFGQGDIGRTGFGQRFRQLGNRSPLSIHVEYDWQPKTAGALAAQLADGRRAAQGWLGPLPAAP